MERFLRRDEIVGSWMGAKTKSMEYLFVCISICTLRNVLAFAHTKIECYPLTIYLPQLTTMPTSVVGKMSQPSVLALTLFSYIYGAPGLPG